MAFQTRIHHKDKPEEMFPVMEDGKYVDKWAIRTTAMIARELGKQNNKAA
ncbi:antirestriction Ral family protein [Escherichia coli]